MGESVVVVATLRHSDATLPRGVSEITDRVSRVEARSMKYERKGRNEAKRMR